MSRLFALGGQSVGISASALVLPMNIQSGLVGSPCSPRDSQESSPTPQFKSISSSVLSFLYGPSLTSTHDYWKNHSFDYCYILQTPSFLQAFSSTHVYCIFFASSLSTNKIHNLLHFHSHIAFVLMCALLRVGAERNFT